MTDNKLNTPQAMVLGAVLMAIPLLFIAKWEAKLSYKQGQLYAYDNVTVCGKDPAWEGLLLSWKLHPETMGDLNPVSSISCEE